MRLRSCPYAIGGSEFLHQTQRRLEGRRRGRPQDTDVALPRPTVNIKRIDGVAAEFEVELGELKTHRRRVGPAKLAALELASRLTGWTQRQIGAYYGGISCAAASVARRREGVVGVAVALPPLNLRRVRGWQYNCHPDTTATPASWFAGPRKREGEGPLVGNPSPHRFQSSAPTQLQAPINRLDDYFFSGGFGAGAAGSAGFSAGFSAAFSAGMSAGFSAVGLLHRRPWAVPWERACCSRPHKTVPGSKSLRKLRASSWVHLF